MREAGHEIPPPELRRVELELARRDLDDPLDHEGRLGPPGATIGIDRRGIGIDGIHLGIDGRDVVLARQQRRVEIGRHRRREGRQVGPEIGDRVHPEAQHLAVGVDREFRMGDVVAAMRVAEERLGAIGGPFHRAADLLGRPDADCLLGIDEDLGAEAAPDVGRDHAQLVFGRDADEGGEHQPRHMRVLAGGVEREAVGARIIIADRGARLHGVRHQPVVDDVELGHVRGAGEGGFRLVLVAEMELEHGVVGRDFVHRRAADLAGAGGVVHRGKHLVVDVDLLGRVLGLGIGVGDHHRDMVPDVAHLALGQRRMRPRLHGRAVLRMDHPAADQAADLVGRKIVAGKHRQDARRCRRRRRCRST